MKASSKNKRFIFDINIALCIVSLIVLSFLCLDYAISPSQLLDEQKDKTTKDVEKAATSIENWLTEPVAISTSIASDLNTGNLKYDEIEDRLNRTMDENPEIFGVVVAFEPNKRDANTDLFSPYVKRNGTGKELIRIEQMYDYTKPDGYEGIRTIWYQKPLSDGPSWTEPYFGTASDTLIAVYGVPFYEEYNEPGKREIAGIVGTVYSLDDIRDKVNELMVGQTGYGFIFTEDYFIASHPNKENLGKEIIKTGDKFDPLHIAMEKKDETLLSYKNKHTGQTLWVALDEINTGVGKWILGAVFVEDEILRDIEVSSRHTLFFIIVASIVFLTSLVLYFTRRSTEVKRLWFVTITLSVLLFGGTFIYWMISLESIYGVGNENIEVYDRNAAESTISKYCCDSGSVEDDSLIRIPTGIFIQSVEFSSANNVIITGYVWQKHINDTSVTMGFILPEAESTDISLSFSNDTVSIWYFNAALRQPFDYSLYPFNKENVWIRFWPNDLRQNVVLVPDFEGYGTIRPEELPGIEKNFVIEGWSVKESYYSYRINEYNTNLGLESGRYSEFPELYFNIEIEPNAISVFMSDAIPLIVIVLLLFAVLMITTVKEKKVGIFGFGSLPVLAFCGSLFFVLMISHISLRENLSLNEFIYFEFFYFELYFAILALSVNSILLASSYNSKIVKYRDNLIVKVSYWPVISFLIFMITFFTFY